MIPKTMHQVWLGSELPAQHAEWAAGWRELHPSWEYVLWDEERVAAYHWQLGHLLAKAEEYAPRHVGQFRADLLRLEILYRHGGVYLDTDMEALRPLDPLLEGLEAFAAWEEPGKWVNNAVVGAVAFHPWVEQLLRGVEGNVRELYDQGVRRPNRLTGPQYVTPVVQDYLLACSTEPRLPGLHIFPKRYFYPYLYTELHLGREPFPDSYAVHHWNNKRRERRKPL